MFEGLLQVLDSCNGLLPIVKLIRQGVFSIIQIGIPIILIVMGSIDLGKAVLSSDDKKIKEAQGMLIKRCISAVLVFFVVTIVTLVMNLIATTEDDDVTGGADWRKCWDEAGR